MKISLAPNTEKSAVFKTVEKNLLTKGFNLINKDANRPWGGFFVINENQADKFVTEYFPLLDHRNLSTQNKLSPKILVVQPGKRLSWQYHFRRAELWKVIYGEVGVISNDTDEETELKKYSTDSLIKLKTGERHRLIGLDNWGIVAEIWQHTDINHPSDEDDIVRLQDDFGR